MKESGSCNMRIGIVGGGLMGAIHARLYERMRGVHLVFVCESDVKRKKTIQTICDAQFLPECTSQILESVDIVDICVPNHLHYKYIEKACIAGTHIIVEKPLCLHLREFEKIKKMIRTQEISLGCCYTERYNPAYVAVRQLVQQEVLGSLHHIHCVRMAKVPPASWYLNKACSGGIISDLSTHDIDILMWIFGKSPHELIAEPLPLEPDMMEKVHLRMDFQGVQGDITTCWLSSTHLEDFFSEIRILCDQGSITWNNSCDCISINTAAGVKEYELPGQDGDEIKFRELHSLIEFLQEHPYHCIAPEGVLETTKATLCAGKSLRERKCITL